jgi:hypothetical protein
VGILSLPSSSPDVEVGHRGPVVVSCFFGWPNRASLQAAAAAQKAVIGQYGRVLTLSVIPPLEVQVARSASVALTLTGPERESVLKDTAGITDDLSAQTIGSAIVILASGVVGVMVRPFIAGMSLLARSQTPLKSFRTIPEAVAFLEGLPGSPGPFPRLAEDVEHWIQSPRAG